jgi:formamidase
MSSIETFLGGGAPSRRELSMIAVQARTVPGNAVATQEGFFEEASRLHAMFPHAQLLLYPELHLSGLAPLGGSQGGSIALPDEPIPGPLTSRLCDLARTLGIWLVPGSLVERAADGAIYNTAIAINPAGEIVARYRKVFPWRPWEKAAAGAEFTVFDMPGIGRVGLMICYDGWFPEVARQLAWMGAEVILQPSATTTVDRPQEIVLARANAIVNQVYVVNVNCSGRPGPGASVVCDPEGRVLYQAGENDEVIPLNLNLDNVALVRTRGSTGLGSRPLDQFEAEARDLHLPMYHGDARGKRAAREKATLHAGG